MACNDCNDCSGSIRYTGPSVDALGISNGDLLEVVLQNLAEFVGDSSGATSVLTNNGDGTYTHDGGGTGVLPVTFTTGQHTTSLIAPVSNSYGDTWYDTTTNILKIFANDGTTDGWVPTTSLIADRFKEETIHHAATTVLALDPNTHNKKEIHYESTGDLSIDGAAHSGSDDYTYLITNTTGADRSITFSNVVGAYIRSGGTITNLSGAGFMIRQNTSALITVTNNGGLITVNGHFYAIASTASTVNRLSTVITLTANAPFIINIPTMTGLDSLTVLDNLNEDIKKGINVNVGAAMITLTSNVTLTGVQVRALYEI